MAGIVFGWNACGPGRGRAAPMAALFGLVMLAGCMAPVPPPMPPAPPMTPPSGMQYLYGSGEAAALSVQAYHALAGFAAAEASKRVSVVLAPGASPAQASFTPCIDRPAAVVFDMDETLVLNLGYEHLEARSGKGFDRERWARWERADPSALAPVPGAVEALAALRRMGVTPVVNTNRNAESAAAAEAALKAVGLGSFRHGETLFLEGDVDKQHGKDGRRLEIARRFCVIAMMGDQLGDFSDGFQGAASARRALATDPAVARLWGRGWFLLPNPVYGSGLAGDWEQIFPTDKRWTDTVEGQGK